MIKANPWENGDVELIYNLPDEAGQSNCLKIHISKGDCPILEDIKPAENFFISQPATSTGPQPPIITVLRFFALDEDLHIIWVKERGEWLAVRFKTIFDGSGANKYAVTGPFRLQKEHAYLILHAFGEPTDRDKKNRDAAFLNRVLHTLPKKSSVTYGRDKIFD